MGSKLLNNLLQEVTGAPPQPVVPRQTQPASAPKPAPRPTTTGTVSAPGQSLKRKAEGAPDGNQVKIQRREAPAQPARPNGAAQVAAKPEAPKPKIATTTNGVPYRGTAGLGGPAKPLPGTVRKPVNSSGVTGAAAKPTTPIAKPAAPVARPSSAPPKTAVPPPATGAPPKKLGYAAMLARAKEVQQSKPAVAQTKAEPTRILTKKERLALRAEAALAAKGKKSGATAQGRPGAVDAKGGLTKEKREPTKLTYQGTARPLSKPPEIGYKGTMRPATAAAGPGGKTSTLNRSKPKSKAGASRNDGYADWSDLSDAEEDGEDYPSEEEESDMEGGLWDMEEEEAKALRVAKQEDAEALREENEHKQQKEERKRKLLALSKAASAKRKF